jgi:hydroxypyruvate isomerase
MSTISQSIAWWCFVPKLMTPEQFVRTAAESGYTAIDIAPQEFWPLIKDHGLIVAATGRHESIESGLNRRENHARIEKELSANIHLAATWGVRNLICFSGNRNGQPDDEGIGITAEGLARVAPVAEAEGVTLILEILNSKVDHPDYQCDHTHYAIEVCKRVNSSRVKLLFDIYHVQIMEGDVIRHLTDAREYTGHYHTAGNPGRHDLDDRQEIHYPGVWGEIKRSGYQGFIAHEFIPKGDPATAMATTFQLCQPYI